MNTQQPISATLCLGDLEETRRFGRKLAGLLRTGDVVLLQGDLGVGKSELARAIIQTRAGAPIDVPSPSFTLVQHYETPGLSIAHADLYRLADSEEAEELALEDSVEQGCLLVEWPDHAPDVFPPDALTIELALAGGDRPDARSVTIEAPSGWAARLKDLLSDPSLPAGPPNGTLAR